MIIGYLLIATAAALVGAIIALMFGATAWYTIVAYTLTGSATMILFPAVRYLMAKPAAPANIADESPDQTAITPVTPDQPADLTDRPMRILAVDDDPFILDLIPLISAKAGYLDVTTAASGKDALALLRNAAQPFDCLLLDLDMPGMDGVELCARIRQLSAYKQAPIIMLTAMRDIQNMGDAFRAGATDYVTKPFDVESLGARLTKAERDIQLQQNANPDGHGAASTRAPLYSPQLLEQLQSHGLGNLVDHDAFSSYLTRLPRKEIAGVQVFAISISESQPAAPNAQSPQFLALLAHLAAVASGAFGANRTLMAFTDDATLLVAINTDYALSALSLEIELATNLHSAISKRLPYYANKVIDVVVGGPVKPQPAQSDRAQATTNLAIGLMEDRVQPKHGRQLKSV